MGEQSLITRYKEASRVYHKLSDELIHHFVGLVDAQPKTAEGLGEVRNILARCPESVAQVFIMDHIRQREVLLGIRKWEKGYDPPEEEPMPEPEESCPACGIKYSETISHKPDCEILKQVIG